MINFLKSRIKNQICIWFREEFESIKTSALSIVSLTAETQSLRAEIVQLQNMIPLLQTEIGVLRFQIEPLQSKLYQNWVVSSQAYARLLQASGKDAAIPPHRDYKVFTNNQSWIDFDQISTPESLVKIAYKKTIDFAGEFVNESHHALSMAPGGRMGVAFLIDIGIDGFLDASEALKIYEMAYFADGNVLGDCRI